MSHPDLAIPLQRPRRGFTLVELLAAIVVIGAVLSVAASIVLSSADAYAAASSQREAEERISLALDRMVRAIREAPEDPAMPGSPDIADAASDAITLNGGVRYSIKSGVLFEKNAAGDASPLCTGVTVFELTYLGGDGLPVDLAGGAPTTDIRRVIIRLAAGGAELQTSVFVRAALNGG